MIASVFVRRLKDGCTFEDFVRAWEADQGFGVPTRIYNAVSLEDPRDVISIGFVALEADELADDLAGSRTSESVRHGRVHDVIASTTLRCMDDLRTEHDFTQDPRVIDIDIDFGSDGSLLRALQERADRPDTD
jgi:hypothetical protein